MGNIPGQMSSTRGFTAAVTKLLDNNYDSSKLYTKYQIKMLCLVLNDCQKTGSLLTRKCQKS